MSTQEMKRYNIKELRNYGDEIYLADTSGDSWIIRGDTLYHCNTRGKENEYHKQTNIKSFLHAVRYISSHATKYTRKPTRMSRMDYLFTLI